MASFQETCRASVLFYLYAIDVPDHGLVSLPAKLLGVQGVGGLGRMDISGQGDRWAIVLWVGEVKIQQVTTQRQLDQALRTHRNGIETDQKQLLTFLLAILYILYRLT